MHKVGRQVVEVYDRKCASVVVWEKRVTREDSRYRQGKQSRHIIRGS
jgi:hypothetical protein